MEAISDNTEINKAVKGDGVESVLRNMKDGLRSRVEPATYLGESLKTEKAEKMESFLNILPSFKGCKRCRNAPGPESWRD